MSCLQNSQKGVLDNYDFDSAYSASFGLCLQNAGHGWALAK